MDNNAVTTNNKISYYDRLKLRMSVESAIHEINVLGGVYNPDFEGLDVYYQLLIYQVPKNNSSIQIQRKIVYDSLNTSVSGVYSDACRHSVDTKLVPSKQNVDTWLSTEKYRLMSELTECHYRTPPKYVAMLLGKLFIEWPGESPRHWLYVSQHWAPRAINRVLRQMVKREERGTVTIANPAAYFTLLIKSRVPRAAE